MRQRHLLAALALAPACSWALVTPPPRFDTGARPLPCTSSLTAPIADTVLVAGELATAGVEGARLATGAKGDKLEIPVVILTVLAAVPQVISAIYGYQHVGRCRALEHFVVRRPVRDLR